MRAPEVGRGGHGDGDWQGRVTALTSERFPLLARRAAPLMRLVLGVWGLLLRPRTLSPARFSRLLSLPPRDRSLIEDPDTWARIAATIREGTRQDRQIAMRELSLLYERDGWGFDPYSSRVPVVCFLGEHAGGGEFARRLTAGSTAPDAQVERFPGGHMGQLAPAVRDRIIHTAANYR